MNHQSAIDAAEAELQQELREMFTVDTQQHLETYFRLIQQLNPQSWATDIQHLYRAIHTVKGGAVTVAADGMLHAAIALEDLLSDLRYLEVAPILADGGLGQILLEAGELLSSSIEITETGDRAIELVRPTVNRLEQLRDRVKQLYLPDWNELKQVHQEFAEQGFDLVVLDLEIALSKMPDLGLVSAQTIDTARATIAQLTQIGIDLELAQDWTIILQECELLITKPDPQLWISVWFKYFELLKNCAKNSGEFTSVEIEQLDALNIAVRSCELSSIDSQLFTSDIDISDSLDEFFRDEEIENSPAIQSAPSTSEFSGNLRGTLDTFFLAEEIEKIPADLSSTTESSDLSEDLLGTLDTFFLAEEIEKIPAAISFVTENDDPSEYLVGAFDTFAQTESFDELPVIELIATTTELTDDLIGTFDTFFSTEEIEESPEIDSIATTTELTDDLIGTFDTFFSTEEIEESPEIDSIATTTELTDDLVGTFDTFAQTESFEELPVIESIAATTELTDDLVGTFDTLAQTEPVEQLSAIESISTTTEFTGDSIESIADTPDLLDNLDEYPAENLPLPDDRETAISEDLSLEELPSSVNILAETLLPQPIVNLEQFPDLSIDEFVTYRDFVELGTDKIVTDSPQQIDAISESEPQESIDLQLPAVAILAPEIPPTMATEVPVPTNPVASIERSIQIPVPLERLDKSAQQVVDTLLTARAVMNISSQLQSQLDRLTTLTRENSQFVTRLRQLQDDYALLRNISDDRQDATNNVTVERYRQGYTTIVRLLENILRLSELGQEIETSTYQSSIRLEALDRSILQLKDGIETSRLVPFRNLILRSKAILRDLTNRYGKPAELLVDNEHIELDAGIVKQLEPALLHLLRNAYDHGLESVQQRLNAGKPAQGKIHISLQQRGNIYRLTIEDDGGGIDANLIHQIAKSKGFALDRTDTNAELLAVLCQPGFSSNHIITEVSGRGVGMDVVISQIANIGGKLSLETYLGLGTKFSIEVPAPQLLLPCVLFQVGDRIVALPTDSVLETALLDSMSVESSEKATGLCTWLLADDRRGEIPGFDLHDYWQTGNLDPTRSSHRSFPDTAVCIRTRQAEDTPEIWSIADDLLGQAKLLIDSLPSPLIAPTGLLGVSLQPDGRLISILDPIALSAMITTTVAPVDRQSAHADSDELATLADNSATAKSSTPTILIVDDAAMIRRRFEASLNTYGFITHTCNDGLEALNWLQNNPHPDLMITDVEMPNMDGFTLIDRARQAKIGIPILVVSSRASEEWGKEARRLGATDYLNKGFATSELIQKVNSLLGLLIGA